MANLVSATVSFSKRKGVLREMHFQVAPFAQAKLIRCTAGAIHDVAVDLRPESETFKQWVAVDASSIFLQAWPMGFRLLKMKPKCSTRCLRFTWLNMHEGSAGMILHSQSNGRLMNRLLLREIVWIRISFSAERLS